MVFFNGFFVSGSEKESTSSSDVSFWMFRVGTNHSISFFESIVVVSEFSVSGTETIMNVPSSELVNKQRANKQDENRESTRNKEDKADK